MPELRPLLRHIVEDRRTFSRMQARVALESILRSDPDPASDIEIAAMLTTMAARGETVDELTGFAEAMREFSTPIPLTDAERAALVDTCGTGGDGRGTFNISTGAALAAAATGAKVAKHGNRGVTSKCGSADVLDAMGIPVAMTAEQSVACLRATGFTFLYAPALHPAMKRVQPIRRALGFRTIFNLAGPLTNPAGAPAQVMGVYAQEKLEIVAGAMAQLGVRCGYVAHARNGIDELALSATDTISVFAPREGAPARTVRRIVHPRDAGLEETGLSNLQGGESPAENAELLESILTGVTKGPKRDVVLLNAAAALEAAGLAADLREGVTRAAEAIDSGAASRVIRELRSFSAVLGR